VAIPSGTSGTVVITGGSGGIGSAILRSLLADGIECVNIDIAPPPAGCESAGHRPCDLADLEAVEALCRDLVSSGVKVSGLVHCAGITQGQDNPVQGSLLADEPREGWLRILTVNLAAPIALTQGLTDALQPGGSVVFFGSGTILKGLPRYSAYIASKAGIVGFSRSIAAELGRSGITVNPVSPGLTATSMNDNVPEAQLEANINGRAIKRAEQPEDIVGAVRFFLSPSSRFITGQMLVVDGGQTISA
jgi:NAD(P)-dependent dehydrogenase (short-subunit alcohol dehydrogenase family)